MEISVKFKKSQIIDTCQQSVDRYQYFSAQLTLSFRIMDNYLQSIVISLNMSDVSVMW